MPKNEPTMRREPSKPLSPEGRRAALEKRRTEAGRGPTKVVGSDFDVEVTPLSATIEGNEIHLSLRIEVEVTRPGVTAIAMGTQVIKMRARLVEHE